MEDESVQQYILMDDDIAVEQIRVNLKRSETEIGYSIAKDYRAMGYGPKILQLAKIEMRNNNPDINS